jgi:hypothetical protein|tara:strand:- start:168 stop:377 length:210 start_codon:yes stop_codon:yes gene_type:complete
MTEEAKVITIDGTEYKQEDLTQDQIHLINKASKWQAEANRLKENFDDANRLHQSYLLDLKTSLADSKTS